MKKTLTSRHYFLLFFCLSSIFYQMLAAGLSLTIRPTPEKLINEVNSSAFSTRPFAFTENKGQVKGSGGLYVKYAFQNGNTQIFLLQRGLAYQFQKTHYPRGYKELVKDKFNPQNKKRIEVMQKQIRIETCRMDMSLVGANKNSKITNEDLNTIDNYYNLNVLDVHSYNKVTYHDIYPGIDWVVYTMGKEVKYDFVVWPGADPSNIKMEFKDHEQISLKKDGGFVVKNKMGSIAEKAPQSFQGNNNIATRFTLTNNVISFSLGNYDHQQSLVIDPTVIWATYYGGSNIDQAWGSCTDASGNVYLVGDTESASNIYSGGHQSTMAGGNADAFLVKFNTSGVRLWGTYYGGNGYDIGSFCATDISGSAYMAGLTQSTLGIASVGHQNTIGGGADVFLAKFNSSGLRQWSTYYGGTSFESGFQGCATDVMGNVYLAGMTQSSAGIASGGHQNTFSGSKDCFLVKFNGAGVRQWGTYYGGGSGVVNGGSCCTDISGNVYLTGSTNYSAGVALAGHQNTFAGGSMDAFLVKFNGFGVRQWATYYGGTATESSKSCSTDAFNNVYMAGTASSTSGIGSGGHQNTYAGNQDAFLIKFDSTGTRQWGTYYGGEQNDNGSSCATDTLGNVYLAGTTQSTAGIATIGAFQNGYEGGADAFLVKFDGNGLRQWGTYYGGAALDGGESCSTDNLGSVYLAGVSGSTFGIASGGHQNIYGGGFKDGFLVKFCNIAPGSALSGNTITCAGTAESYSVTYDPNSSYFWTLPGGWIGSSTTNTMLLTPNASGVFTLIVFNSCSRSTQTLNLVVSSTLSALMLTGNNITCAGNAQNYSVIYDPTAAYNWSLPATFTGSSTTNTISITAASSGVFSLTVSNGCGVQTQTMNLVVDLCVGIENYAFDPKQLFIYPNPGNGEFVIEASASTQIVLTNVLGQIILEKTIYPGHNYLNLNSQAKGIYFIRSKESESRAIKIVKE